MCLTIYCVILFKYGETNSAGYRPIIKVNFFVVGAKNLIRHRVIHRWRSINKGNTRNQYLSTGPSQSCKYLMWSGSKYCNDNNFNLNNGNLFDNWYCQCLFIWKYNVVFITSWIIIFILTVIFEVVVKVYVIYREISPPVSCWSNAITRPLLAPN